MLDFSLLTKALVDDLQLRVYCEIKFSWAYKEIVRLLIIMFGVGQIKMNIFQHAWRDGGLRNV